MENALRHELDALTKLQKELTDEGDKEAAKGLQPRIDEVNKRLNCRHTNYTYKYDSVGEYRSYCLSCREFVDI